MFIRLAPFISGYPAQTFHQSLIAAALNGRRNAHRLAIFRDRSAGDFDALASQAVDKLIVGEDVIGAFRIDELFDPMAD